MGDIPISLRGVAHTRLEPSCQAPHLIDLRPALLDAGIPVPLQVPIRVASGSEAQQQVQAFLHLVENFPKPGRGMAVQDGVVRQGWNRGAFLGVVRLAVMLREACAFFPTPDPDNPEFWYQSLAANLAAHGEDWDEDRSFFDPGHFPEGLIPGQPHALCGYMGLAERFAILVEHRFIGADCLQDQWELLNAAERARNAQAMRAMIHAFGLADPENQRAVMMFHLAAQAECMLIMQSALACGLTVDAASHGRTALHVAATNPRLTVLEFLLEHGASPNVRDRAGNTPLHLATQLCLPTHVTALLAHKADDTLANRSGMPALHVALRKDRNALALIHAFIQGGAHVDVISACGMTPLHKAVLKGLDGVARTLLSSGADLEARDLEGRAPLHWAAILGRNVMLERLITNGANLHAEDHAGRSVLYSAADSRAICAVVCADLLRRAGVDLDEPNSLGQTPLCLSVERGSVNALQTLVGLGADVEATNRLGQSPLRLAAALDRHLAIEHLLGEHANPEAADVAGNTAMHLAALAGHLNAVKALLRGHARADVRNQEGKTPLALARANGQQAVVDVLEAWPAVAPD